MKLDELKGWIDSHDGWDYQLDDKGIIIRNERFETLTHATFEAVEKNSLERLTASCSHGKDVDHITRVTGYFSKTSGWNRGKSGELKDRHRTKVQ